MVSSPVGKIDVRRLYHSLRHLPVEEKIQTGDGEAPGDPALIGCLTGVGRMDHGTERAGEFPVAVCESLSSGYSFRFCARPSLLCALVCAAVVGSRPTVDDRGWFAKVYNLGYRIARDPTDLWR